MGTPLPIVKASQCPRLPFSLPRSLIIAHPQLFGTSPTREVALKLMINAFVRTDGNPGLELFPGSSSLCLWVANGTGGPRGQRDGSAKHNGPSEPP